MRRRGQITIFIIVGFIFLMIIAMAAYMVSKDTKLRLQTKTIDMEGLQDYTETCIENTLREAVFEVGYSNISLLQDYLDFKVPECTAGFSGLDMDVKEGPVSSSAFLTHDEDFVVVEVYYPLSVVNEGRKSELSRFNVKMALTSVSTIQLSSGQAANPVNIVSADRRSSLFIPQGTDVGAPLGLTAPVATITVIDVNEALVHPGYVLGNLIYDLQPEGMTFDPPITLTISYDEDIIPVPETDLRISYDNGGYWVNVPSTVDTANDVVTAELSHFSEYTVTCGALKCWNLTFNFSMNATGNMSMNTSLNLTNMTMGLSDFTIGLNDTCINLTNASIDFSALNLTNISLNITQNYTIDLNDTTVNLTDLCQNISNATNSTP